MFQQGAVDIEKKRPLPFRQVGRQRQSKVRHDAAFRARSKMETTLLLLDGRSPLPVIPAFAQPRGVEQHAAGPAIDVVVADHLAHAPHALALLVRRHGQRR